MFYKLSVLTMATKLEDAHINFPISYVLVSLFCVAEINLYFFFKFKIFCYSSNNYNCIEILKSSYIATVSQITIINKHIICIASYIKHSKGLEWIILTMTFTDITK